jgi:hypothetical protein
MGLKANGSLAGLQNTTLSGGGIFVSQRAMFRSGSDAHKRRLAFIAVSAIPHGYGINGIALPITGGGLASRVRGTAQVVAGLDAKANMATAVTGSVTLTGLAAAGRGMAVTIAGTVNVVAGMTAKANMAVNVVVNAAPKPIDIAGEIMGTLLSNGQTVSQSLVSIQDVKNTTTAVLGLSV